MYGGVEQIQLSDIMEQWRNVFWYFREYSGSKKDGYFWLAELQLAFQECIYSWSYLIRFLCDGNCVTLRIDGWRRERQCPPSAERVWGCLLLIARLEHHLSSSNSSVSCTTLLGAKSLCQQRLHLPSFYWFQWGSWSWLKRSVVVADSRAPYTATLCSRIPIRLS
jgi:hypothetical protein